MTLAQSMALVAFDEAGRTRRSGRPPGRTVPGLLRLILDAVARLALVAAYFAVWWSAYKRLNRYSSHPGRPVTYKDWKRGHN